MYLGSSISSTESNINIRVAKAWTANHRLSITWMFDLSDKIIQFLRSSGCVNSTIWMHHMDTKCFEKKRDGNCTRLLRTVLNKSWKQRSTIQQLNSHLPLISKIIQIGQCWRSKDKLMRHSPLDPFP